MGQLVAVTDRPSSTRGQLRFELNRSLTGMGHEHYSSLEQTTGGRPADVLARRLFETGQVDAVHVYSNIVTIELARNADPRPLTDVVRTLYRYWQPGMQPPAFEDLVAPDEAAGAAAPAGDEGAGGGRGAVGGRSTRPGSSARTRQSRPRALEGEGRLTDPTTDGCSGDRCDPYTPIGLLPSGRVPANALPSRPRTASTSIGTGFSPIASTARSRGLRNVVRGESEVGEARRHRARRGEVPQGRGGVVTGRARTPRRGGPSRRARPGR